MFLNPLMLAGLGGAVLPLVLHLLSRARHRDVAWGAMMFLPGSNAQQRRSARLKQIVLLALRMVIVALLAIALARPVLSGAWARGVTPGGPASTVLLLDCSASMGYQSNGPTRFDAARRAALGVVQRMSSGDEAAVVLLGADDLQQPLPLTSDLRSVALRLSDAAVTPSRCDAAAALDAALRVLRNARSVERRIVLVTDRQAENWKQADDAFAASWRRALAEQDARSGSRTTFQVIAAGGDEHDNVAIESAAPLGGAPLVRDQFGYIEARVHNYGDAPRADVPVSLYAGARPWASASLTLPPRSSATTRLPVRLGNTGSHLLSVRLGQPGMLSSDDRFDLAVEVVDPTHILILTDASDTDDTSSAAHYLRLALTPFRSAGERVADAFVVETTSTADAAVAALDADARPELIIICDGFRPSAQLVRRIEQFAYNGGGVVLAPGRFDNPDRFNQLFHREAASLAPASLGSVVKQSNKASQRGQALSWLDVTHPSLFFAHGQSAAARGEHVLRCFSSELSPDARVLAKLEDGSALLVERRFGRGRAVMFTAPLDPASSTLPFSNLYLPLVQSLARYLAAGDRPQLNLLPMEPIETEVEDAVGDRATLVLPDNTRVVLDVPRRAATGAGTGPRAPSSRVRFEQTAQPGRYELRWRTPAVDRVSHFVVRAPAEESDLTPLTPQEWATLRKRLDFDLVAANELQAGASAVERAEPPDPAGREAWPLMLAALAGLLVIESLLGRAWSATPQPIGGVT